ncbi:MAG: hypothetical protein LBQ15_05900 [Clostridium sp.]|jgi:hypothetical protein|nr:hypothetical protein [Clostridium sp.]
MKSLNYWQQFLGSGRIDDYLSYIHKEKKRIDASKPQAQRLGVNPYAGVHMCDRNDFKADACRGM